MNNELQPKMRSKLRLAIGKKYYTGRRYLWWWFGNHKFSKANSRDILYQFKYEYFSHSTPLLRQLKDVDMYLQYNKITNLKIALQKLNHVVIYPGETFSYWKLIGNPNKKKGYVKRMILSNGTFKPGIGGGLCQLSNMIYWMAIHTPLTIVERYRHSFDVFPDSNRTQPFGSGATCVFNYRDLVIKNDTEQPFELCLNITETDLQGSWKSNVSPSYTYKVYEKEHQMILEYWGGYSRHNVLFRKVYDINNFEVAEEYIVENHALMMYSPFISDKSMKGV